MSKKREKDALISKARHNLKNPVNAILGFSEMLIEDCEDEGFDTILPDLKKIHDSGTEILKIIEESLSDSKIRIFGKKYDTDIQGNPDRPYSYIQDFKVQKTKPQIFQSFVNIKQYNELSEAEKNKIIHLMYQPNPQTPFHYAHISHIGIEGIPSCKENSTLLEFMYQYACINTGVHFFSDTKTGLYSKLNKFFTAVNPIYFESNIYTTLFFPSEQINERFTSTFVK